MDSVIKIFENLAKDDEARQGACSEFAASGVCSDMNCSECVLDSSNGAKRAANTLKNRLGG